MADLSGAEAREQIARMVDPLAWAPMYATCDRQVVALARADSILARFPQIASAAPEQPDAAPQGVAELPDLPQPALTGPSHPGAFTALQMRFYALAAIAAARRVQGSADGEWAKVVPVKPTDAMIEAYCRHLESLGYHAWVNLSSLWPVVLAAAPPAQSGGEVGQADA